MHTCQEKKNIYISLLMKNVRLCLLEVNPGMNVFFGRHSRWTPSWLGSQRGLHRLPSENDRCRPQETEWGVPSLSSLSCTDSCVRATQNTRAQKTASGGAQFRTSLLKFDFKQNLHITTLRLYNTTFRVQSCPFKGRRFFTEGFVHVSFNLISNQSYFLISHDLILISC